MRICPKCGKKFPFNRERCNALPKCETVTVPYVEVTDSESEVEEDLREDLKGQADIIHDLLETYGPMTYERIAKLIGVSPKRASNIVSVMIRDGVELKREGSPRTVSIG